MKQRKVEIENDYLGNCERCGKALDTRTAYHQTELDWLCGQKVRVNAHYCQSCCSFVANGDWR